MVCLEEDLGEWLTHLRFPGAHWKAIRTCNLLERMFGEGKRWTKGIARFPSDSSGLRLLYAGLITASQGSKGLRVHPDIWLEVAVRGTGLWGARANDHERARGRVGCLTVGGITSGVLSGQLGHNQGIKDEDSIARFTALIGFASNKKAAEESKPPTESQET